jgi:hypothetical protein
LAKCYEVGDLERARELEEENLRQGRATHDELLEGVALDALANVAVEEGRLEDAVLVMKERHSPGKPPGDPVVTLS